MCKGKEMAFSYILQIILLASNPETFHKISNIKFKTKLTCQQQSSYC